MPQPEWKQIEEFSFMVSPILGMRNMRVSAKIANIVGKGASNGFAGIKNAKGDTDKMMAFFGLLASVEPDEIEFLCRELLDSAVVKVGNNPQTPVMQVFDTIFQARIDVAYKLLWEALRVNYGNLFKGLFAKLGAQAAVESSFQPTSPPNGPAGA